MTTEELKSVNAIREALVSLNADAEDPNCTTMGYATQARTRIIEEIIPALVQLGLDGMEMAPVPQA